MENRKLNKSLNISSNMKINKNLIVFTLLLVLLFSVSLPNLSAQDYNSHKQSTDYTLLVSSNNATSCDISYIKYPNNTKNILNKNMTQDGRTFYADIDSGNFTNTGITCFGITCTDGSTNEVGSKCIDVTLSGTDPDSSSSYIALGLLGLIFGIACVFLFITFKVQEGGIKIFFLLSSFVFLIGSLATAYVVSFDMNLTSGINTTITVMLYAFGLIMFVVVAYILINQIRSTLELIQQKKGYYSEF